MATAAQEPAAGRQTERQQLLGGRLSNDDAGDEQREKLLADDVESGSSEDGQRRPRSKPSRPWPAAFFVAISFLGLFTLLALVKLSLFHTPRTAKTEHQVATTFTRRPSSEYVLISDWDFNAAPTVREYHWVVSDMEGNPDGVFRPMIIINGQFPGEMIRCNRGDTVVVNVENRAVNATSIHWHGIFQNGTNWMDGTVGVTQCPIAPGGKFRYEFKVDGQAGTYFYHGHYAAQALDGLVGPIVIHSPEERQNQQIPYVTDRVVMLQDWYHDLSSGLLLQTLSPGSESSPVPNGALLNGANVLDCSLHPNRRCDNSTASLPSWDLSPNANHRLRLLNVGAFAWFEVTVDEHPTLPITEIDGVDIEPSPEKSVLLGPGQRYSVILSTEDTKSDAVWFRARMVTHCFAENVLPEQGQPEVKAAIVYSSGAIDAATATTQDPIVPTSEPDRSVYAVQCRDMRTRKYDPVPAVRAPERADHSWRVRVNLAIGDWRLERGYLNQSSYRVVDPRSPTLHRLVDGLRSGNDSFLAKGYNDRAFDPERELVVSSRGAAEVVDVVLQNMDEGNHPFHLHGAQMFALASGHGYFPGYEALGFHAHGRGLLDPANDTVVANPVRRDVATVEGFGWALIRFVADNPGVWLFHCHMTWHGEAGMAMQFVSRVDDMKSWEIPEQNARLCEAKLEELEKGGVPKDDIWVGSFGT